MVEYLRTCNSVLVNPTVFTNVPAAASRHSQSTRSSSPNSLASKVDGKSVNSKDGNDMKSVNREEKLLNYKDFLIKSVHERKYSVITKKLSLDIINQWTGRVPHWSQIDPYSSLEDEGSSNSDADSTKNSKNSDGAPLDNESDADNGTDMEKQTLQPRKRNYTCERPRHTHTSSVFYQKQCSTPKRSPPILNPKWMLMDHQKIE